MANDAELREILSDMAEDILQFDPFPASWHIWIIHILKYFDHTAQRAGDQGEYIEMLEKLQQAIAMRVKMGKW